MTRGRLRRRSNQLHVAGVNDLQWRSTPMDSLNSAPCACNDLTRGRSHKIDAVYLAGRGARAVRFRRGAPEAVGRSAGLPLAQHAGRAPARGAATASVDAKRSHERHRVPGRWRRARTPWTRLPGSIRRRLAVGVSRSAAEPRVRRRARRLPALFDRPSRAGVGTLSTLLRRARGAS